MGFRGRGWRLNDGSGGLRLRRGWWFGRLAAGDFETLHGVVHNMALVEKPIKIPQQRRLARGGFCLLRDDDLGQERLPLLGARLGGMALEVIEDGREAG